MHLPFGRVDGVTFLGWKCTEHLAEVLLVEVMLMLLPIPHYLSLGKGSEIAFTRRSILQEPPKIAFYDQ